MANKKSALKTYKTKCECVILFGQKWRFDHIMVTCPKKRHFLALTYLPVLISRVGNNFHQKWQCRHAKEVENYKSEVCQLANFKGKNSFLPLCLLT